MSRERERFVSTREADWRRLDELLSTYGAVVDGPRWSELASLYRRVCADLSRVRSADLGDDIAQHLDELTARAHDRMYALRPRLRSDALHVVVHELPRQVRASWRFVLTAALLFYGPFLLCGVSAFLSDDVALQVLDADMLHSMEQMYERPPERSVADNLTMAGFYVYNNVGIALRCFATGVFGGLGSAFFLVYNGAVLGTVFGHLSGTGHGWNLLDFTAGHSAWELNGIVLAGAAGLRLGWALVRTEGLTRAASARAAGVELFRLVTAASVMLFVAAAIEGLWSANPLPLSAKLVFGALQVLLVGLWLGLGGRDPA